MPVLLLTACAVSGGQEPSVREAGTGAIPVAGLLVDLDADRDVTLETRPDLAGEGHRMGEVSAWGNQVKGGKIINFRNFRPGGRPALRGPVAELNGHHAIVFDEDELVNSAEDALDHLTTGSGFTWAAVIAGHRQVPTRAPYKDINAFFGNLKNGPEFEGVWAGFDDDNEVSMNPRNSRSFGTWNRDNPKLTGPRLEEGRFHVVAGRLGAGRGAVMAELFVDLPTAVDRAPFEVVPGSGPVKTGDRTGTRSPGSSRQGSVQRRDRAHADLGKALVRSGTGIRHSASQVHVRCRGLTGTSRLPGGRQAKLSG